MLIITCVLVCVPNTPPDPVARATQCAATIKERLSVISRSISSAFSCQKMTTNHLICHRNVMCGSQRKGGFQWAVTTETHVLKGDFSVCCSAQN